MTFEEKRQDVHTEHCCVIHGCKYGDDDCTVTTRRKPQSFVCEYCSIILPVTTQSKKETTFVFLLIAAINNAVDSNLCSTEVGEEMKRWLLDRLEQAETTFYGNLARLLVELGHTDAAVQSTPKLMINRLLKDNELKTQSAFAKQIMDTEDAKQK